MDNLKELKPQFENVKSYYKKAMIEYTTNGIVLYSYEVKIATIKDNKYQLHCDDNDLTRTTLRHLKEFLQQNKVYNGEKKNDFIKVLEK